MASGVYPELELRLTERARRRRVRGRGGVGLLSGVALREPSEGTETELPGVISVDPTSGEVVIDLRTIEERARSIDLVTDSVREEPPPAVTVVPRVARNRAKRAFDVTVVTITAPLWGTAVLVLAGLVRMTSRGPAFYRHERVGRSGRPIGCLKLRTMVVDADARLAELLESDPALAEEFALTFKLKTDPRVTRLGRMLRRTSLDELPQLVNVLRGEMSLVGPRPITEEEMRRYGQYMPIVLSARPGLTGPMQVFGRGRLSFEERLSVERDYIENLSISRDLRILALTVPSVFDGRGAY